MDPFISREDLSDYIGSDVTSDDKALIAVDSACDIVRTYTGLTVNQVDDDTITLDGTGTDALVLPERPIINAGTVVESGGTLTLDTDYLVGEGVLYRKPGVIDSGWSTQELRTYWWPGRRNIEVTYSHGWADDDIPRDIRFAALSIAARTYQRSADVIFESLGQRSIRYSDSTQAGLNGTEKLILDLYRR